MRTKRLLPYQLRCRIELTFHALQDAYSTSEHELPVSFSPTKTYLCFSIRIKFRESSRENSDHNRDEQRIGQTGEHEEYHRTKIRMELRYDVSYRGLT